MTTRIAILTLLALAASGCARAAAADPVVGARDAAQHAEAPFLLGPPPADGPVVVRARFALHGINEISDELETFDFAGVLVLEWSDPRQVFDPAVAGVEEKVFQGDFQFDEISPGWFPQIVLVNDFGQDDTLGIVLRVRPDGTARLIQRISATVRVQLDMRRYPFDSHRLEAIFEVLGFDRDEVVLEVDAGVGGIGASLIPVPQWNITAVDQRVRDRATRISGRTGVSSVLVVAVQAERKSFFVVRLVVLPLVVIVLLSFSVFWMDRSTLGDRTSVSFIGILTAMTFQIVTSDQLPRIAYFTLMHGFLNLSFLTMCATVAINLVVGALDKRGEYGAGDLIDRRCRWIFPLVYFGLNLVMLGVAFTFF